MAKILDTNILIRYLIEDEPEKVDRIEKLLKNSRDELIIPDVIVAEIVWLLGSFYKHDKEGIVEKLQAILSLDTIKLNRQVIFQTIEIFKSLNVSWIDAYGSALVRLGEADGIYSYDKGIDKISGVKRLEP